MKNEYPQFKNFVSYSEEKFSKKPSKSDFPFRMTWRTGWDESEGKKCENNKAEYAKRKKEKKKSTKSWLCAPKT